MAQKHLGQPLIAVINYLEPQQSQDKWLANNQNLNQILKASGVLEQIKAHKKQELLAEYSV